MREIPKMIGNLLIIALLLAHFFMFALFIAPADKLLGMMFYNQYGFIDESELPGQVRIFLIDNGIPVEGRYMPDETIKIGLFMGILRIREQYFMDDSEKLVLNMNLLDFGSDVVGLKAASEHFYKRPLPDLSAKEWITLVNLQNILSRNNT